MKKVAVILVNDMHMDLENANKLLNHIYANYNYEVVCDYTIADIIIIMTCAFGKKILSIRTIADVQLNSSADSEIIVTGCLANFKELQYIPYVTVKPFFEVLDFFGNVSSKSIVQILPQNKVIISEGCRYKCSYCVYPLIMNQYKSKPIEDIIKEVEVLYQTESTIYITGAQETSDYGIDLYGKRYFSVLLEKIVTQFPDCNYVIGWFNPAGFTDEVIDIISNNSNIKEIMLHIQHVSDDVLKRMNRPSFDQTYDWIKKLKSNRPDIIISTEVIVGFPGETEKDFTNLIIRLDEGFFNDIGVASYEKVFGTIAAKMPNQVPFEIKQERMSIIQKRYNATTYPAQTSEQDGSFIISEYIYDIERLSQMPKKILNDSQKYCDIAGIDTNYKFEKFEECIEEVLELIQNSRSRYDILKNTDYIHQKYTLEARKLFYEVINKLKLKEALLRRAKRILLQQSDSK